MYKENYNKIHKREINYIARFTFTDLFIIKKIPNKSAARKMPYAEIPKQPISAPETAGTNPVTIKISSRAATEVMQIPTICLGFSFCFFILSVT